jgi:diadenosine tetraphosphate (Ap4A) HIT family hydrolase
VRRGHLLVVLRRHVERFEDILLPEWQDAQRVAWEAARAVESALGASRVYIASLGSVTQRPMTFPHHHLHVVPTYRGDRRDRPARVFTWQDGVVLQDDREAAKLTRELRSAWPRALKAS